MKGFNQSYKVMFGVSILLLVILLIIIYILFLQAPRPVPQDTPVYYCPYDSAQLAWQKMKQVDYLHCPGCGRNYLIQMIIKGELHCIETLPGY